MSKLKMMLGAVPEVSVAPVSLKKRKLMLYAILIFVATASLAVLVNSTVLGYGFHLTFSISRYVGLETWSSIIFALGNAVVAGCIASYLYYLARIWQLPRWFNWLVILMVATLIALSVCPVFYFDTIPGVKSTPTLVHEISSRTMFLAMLITAIVFMVCGRVSAKTRRESLLFATYGIICVCGYFSGAEWFPRIILLLESFYLLWFMVLCLACRSKGQEKVFKKEMTDGGE